MMVIYNDSNDGIMGIASGKRLHGYGKSPFFRSVNRRFLVLGHGFQFANCSFTGEPSKIGESQWESYKVVPPR